MDSIQIPDRLYFRIGDVADLADVKPYVLRYWESEFPVIQPEKSSTGQRVYRRSDVETILLIKHLLYKERYSIEGARQRIRELRKEGELKNFKQEIVQPKVSAEEAQVRAETCRQLQSMTRELRSLIKTPIREVFKY